MTDFALSETHADGALVIRQVLGDASFVVDLYFAGNPTVAKNPNLDSPAITNRGQGITEHIDGAIREHYPIRIATGATVSIALVERCVRAVCLRILDARAQERAKSTSVVRMYPSAASMMGRGINAGTMVQTIRRALEGAKLGRFKDSIVP